MHELSIAHSLAEQVARIARENRAVRVLEVEVHCGVMRQVVPEALAVAFEAVTAETVAAGAQLRIVEEALTACCRPCGTSFAATIDNYLCPRCGQADVEVLTGRDIVLRTVICETAAEASI